MIPWHEKNQQVLPMGRTGRGQVAGLRVAANVAVNRRLTVLVA